MSNEQLRILVIKYREEIRQKIEFITILFGLSLLPMESRMAYVQANPDIFPDIVRAYLPNPVDSICNAQDQHPEPVPVKRWLGIS